MTKIWGVNVEITGTLYVKAEAAEEANEKVREKLSGCSLEVPENAECDIPISGVAFSDPSFPEVSLSPAMTVQGLDREDSFGLMYSDEDEEDESEKEPKMCPFCGGAVIETEDVWPAYSLFDTDNNADLQEFQCQSEDCNYSFWV